MLLKIIERMSKPITIVSEKSENKNFLGLGLLFTAIFSISFVAFSGFNAFLFIFTTPSWMLITGLFFQTHIFRKTPILIYKWKTPDRSGILYKIHLQNFYFLIIHYFIAILVFIVISQIYGYKYEKAVIADNFLFLSIVCVTGLKLLVNYYFLYFTSTMIRVKGMFSSTEKVKINLTSVKNLLFVFVNFLILTFLDIFLIGFVIRLKAYSIIIGYGLLFMEIIFLLTLLRISHKKSRVFYSTEYYDVSMA